MEGSGWRRGECNGARDSVSKRDPDGTELRLKAFQSSCKQRTTETRTIAGRGRVKQAEIVRQLG